MSMSIRDRLAFYGRQDAPMVEMNGGAAMTYAKTAEDLPPDFGLVDGIRDPRDARIAELEAALRPFADFNTQGCWEHTAWRDKPDATPVLHNHVTGLEISIGDFHNATRAMRTK